MRKNLNILQHYKVIHLQEKTQNLSEDANTLYVYFFCKSDSSLGSFSDEPSSISCITCSLLRPLHAYFYQFVIYK